MPLTPPPIPQQITNSGEFISTPWASWFTNAYNAIVGANSESLNPTVQMQVNTTYYANSAVLITYTLPTAFNIGDSVQVIGVGAGGWLIAQNSGQTIRSTTSTTTGITGSLASTNQYDTVTLKGMIKNIDLNQVASKGVLTVV